MHDCPTSACTIARPCRTIGAQTLLPQSWAHSSSLHRSNWALQEATTAARRLQPLRRGPRCLPAAAAATTAGAAAAVPALCPPPPRPMAAASPAWRQELFCSAQQLPAVVAVLQKSTNLAGVNLPNKAKSELPALLERCRAARAALPHHVDICCHYAINQNWVPRDTDATQEQLEMFAAELAAVGGCSLLLVTGGGQRRSLCSLKVSCIAAGPAGVLARPCSTCKLAVTLKRQPPACTPTCLLRRRWSA